MNRLGGGPKFHMTPENFRALLRVGRSAQTSEKELREMFKYGIHFLPWTLSMDGAIYLGKHDHNAKLAHIIAFLRKTSGSGAIIE